MTIATQPVREDARDLLDPFPADAQMEEEARNRDTCGPEGGPVEHVP